MIRKTKATSAAALTAVAALSLAACGGGSKDGGEAAGGEAEKGGTLHYLTFKPAESLDPQRIYIGRDIFNTSRLVYRGLLQFPVGEQDPIKAQTPIPDIAEEVPTSKDGKTWTFKLKSGVKWEDGKDVTCEDFKYGVSRNFASDVLDGGPFQYPTGYLDIPKDKDGSSRYKGPYKKTGQDLFDKAVTCKGNELTYKFNKSWADFPAAVAGLHAFAPYREDKDQGAKNKLVVFSNGPYKLEGAWSKNKGGTFVRNDQYDPKTDEGTRAANPDKIVFTQGLENEIIADRLVKDSGDDKYAITDRNIPPSKFATVKPAESRTTNVTSPYVFYLVPNVKNMPNVKVRQALATATDKEAYIAAEGGSKASEPAVSIINPSMEGYAENPAFKDLPAAGDPEAAKKLLEESGVKTPVKLKVTYQKSPIMDKAFRALKEGWDKAGFDTQLNPLADTYYDVINKPSNDSDVFQGGWGADYPSLATVLPLLFDGGQLSAANVGNNYGRYDNPEVNKAFEDALTIEDPKEAAAAYQKVDVTLGEDYAYIPLDIQKFYFLRGSKVTGYQQTEATSMFPDLGTIGVAK